VRLLNRSTRSLSLTDEGRSYLEFCEQVFRDIENNERAIVHTRAEPAGTLKLASPKSFGSLELGDAIVAFAAAQPKLRVTLMLEDVSFRRPSDFAERGLDMAIRISSLHNTSLIERPIMDCEWVVCASPDYLARHGRPATPNELTRHACLIHSNVTPNDRIWRLEGPSGPMSVKVDGAFFSNSALVLRKAALAGVGIALIPGYSIADEIESGALVTVLPRYRAAPRPLLAVFPRSAKVPQKIEVFVAFLRDWLRSREINPRSLRAVAGSRR